MPSSEQHKDKYLENKEVLEVLDIKNKNHCDWITTICFYSALHIIDMKLAISGKHPRTHTEREKILQNSQEISIKTKQKYKQMSSNSRVARYEKGKISQTITDQMLRYLRDIENELFPTDNKNR